MNQCFFGTSPISGQPVHTYIHMYIYITIIVIIINIIIIIILYIFISIYILYNIYTHMICMELYGHK